MTKCIKMWKNVQTSSQMLSLAALLAVCYGIKRANAARVLCRAGIRASRRPTRAASAAGRGSQPGNRGRVVSVVALTGITGSWEHRSQCKLACQESARAQSQAKSPLLKSKAAEALWFSSLCFFLPCRDWKVWRRWNEKRWRREEIPRHHQQ